MKMIRKRNVWPESRSWSTNRFWSVMRTKGQAYALNGTRMYSWSVMHEPPGGISIRGHMKRCRTHSVSWSLGCLWSHSEDLEYQV
jgi:hypothetical protein